LRKARHVRVAGSFNGKRAETVRIEVKLYAGLGKYLPDSAVSNVAKIDVQEGTTPMDIINQWQVPVEYCHLVLINGNYVEPSARTTRTLQDGDALAIWPPVAGG